MKTIDEIAQEIKAAFINNAVLQVAYDLTAGQTFDEQFAASSVEANFVNLYATAAAAQESLFEQYKIDVEDRILAAFPGTVAWYHNLILNFEYVGEKIIKYAAVIEEYPHLLIKVNTADFGVLAIESDQLVALRAYVAEKKFAGTYISIISYAADDVNPTIQVWLDPAKYDSSGTHLVDSDKKVELAIDAYLASVKYNGTMNKTKLVDAIQAVDGVRDVLLGDVVVTRADTSVVTISGNNYSSFGGAFVSTTKTMTYVLS